jgi:hypothetical protein
VTRLVWNTVNHSVRDVWLGFECRWDRVFPLLSRPNRIFVPFYLITMRTTGTTGGACRWPLFCFFSWVKNARSCTSTLRLRIHGLVLRHNSNLPLCFEISEVNPVCPNILETFCCPLWVAEQNIDQCHRGGRSFIIPERRPCPILAVLVAIVQRMFILHFPFCRSLEGLLTDDVTTNHLI